MSKALINGFWCLKFKKNVFVSVLVENQNSNKAGYLINKYLYKIGFPGDVINIKGTYPANISRYIPFFKISIYLVIVLLSFVQQD
jgi:hypothetical protein